MMPRCVILILLGVLLGTLAPAQTLVLKDGTRIAPEEYELKEGKILRTVRIEGSTARSVMELPPAVILQLDWPYVQQLVDAREMMTQGRADEAVERLREGLAILEVFKTVRGGAEPYAETLFAYVEALALAGEFEATVSVLPKVERLPLSEQQKLKLEVLKLDLERQTSSNALVTLGRAENLLASTDDSEVSAAVWEIIAEVHERQKKWEEALMAYLRIPVFYGTQLDRVPAAELGAGRMLVKMRRFADAQTYFERVIESYPGSRIADEAQQALTSIRGMKNDPPAS